jgi:hypothetical protein
MIRQRHGDHATDGTPPEADILVFLDDLNSNKSHLPQGIELG